MPRGAPDYGAYAAKSTVSPMSDMAELARRLDAIPSIDGKGDVVFLEDFEGSMAAVVTWGIGTGASQTQDATRAAHGSRCLKVVTGDARQRGGFERWQPYPALSRFGIEIAFTNVAYIDSYAFFLHLFTPSQRHKYEVHYDAFNEELDILQADGTYATIATTLQLNIEDTLFHVAKMVVDVENQEYVRFILDEKEYDINAYGPRIESFTQRSYLLAGCDLRSWTVGRNDTAYLDAFIITQNEP